MNEKPNHRYHRFRQRVSPVERSSKMRHADIVMNACRIFARNTEPRLRLPDRQHLPDGGQREPILLMVETRARLAGVATRTITMQIQGNSES